MVSSALQMPKLRRGLCLMSFLSVALRLNKHRKHLNSFQHFFHRLHSSVSYPGSFNMATAELKSEEEYVVTGKRTKWREATKQHDLLKQNLMWCVGDIKIIERFWEVPLDYEQAAQEGCKKIQLFGRTAVPVAKEKDNIPISGSFELSERYNR